MSPVPRARGVAWLPAAFCLLALPAALLAEEKVVTPFGKNLRFDGWAFKGPKERSKWVAGHATLDAKDNRQFSVTVPHDAQRPIEMINQASSVDIYTEAKFGDCTIELELMVPKGSNSGVYVMGEYEVQILDSYGKKKVGPGDLGGLYGAAAPKKNVAKAPGEWQTLVIEFQAPKFEGEKKTANAKFLKVTLNGEVIHENVEVKGPTPSCLTGKEAATGPLMFQGDHGPVAFRNIRITTK